jgi:hypothetical protein
MNKTNRNRDRNKQIIPLAAIALSAVVLLTGVVSIATSGTKAKYRQTVQAGDVAVTVNADLVSGLEVKEHLLTGANYDDYSLDSNTEVSSNSYTLMPGVPIPKDPFVKITGKTAIPSYLYVEVVDPAGLVTSGSEAAFTYSLRSGWTKLDGVTGKHGGTVYVYTGTLSTGDSTVPILQDDRIIITSYFDKASNYSGTLTFYAYLAQKVDSKTAVQTFEAQFPPLP